MPRMLKELADVLPVEEKLDAVVVDEAQEFAPEQLYVGLPDHGACC